jgi:hypothetical protein
MTSMFQQLGRVLYLLELFEIRKRPGLPMLYIKATYSKTRPFLFQNARSDMDSYYVASCSSIVDASLALPFFRFFPHTMHASVLSYQGQNLDPPRPSLLAMARCAIFQAHTVALFFLGELKQKVSCYFQVDQSAKSTHSPFPTLLITCRNIWSTGACSEGGLVGPIL